MSVKPNYRIDSSGSGRGSRSRDGRLGLDSWGLGRHGARDSSRGRRRNPTVVLVLVLGVSSRSVALSFVSIASVLIGAEAGGELLDEGEHLEGCRGLVVVVVLVM